MKKKMMNADAFFKELTNDSPFLKMGIEGFAGSGKTFLAASLAIGLHKRIKSTKPIVVYDTERAFSKIKDLFDESGIKVMVRNSRSLKDWTQTVEYMESGYSDILITDSVSHIWSQFISDYLEAKKKRINKNNIRISFPDWSYLKPKWKSNFSDNIINSKFHLIFTGRASYEYEHQEDDETGKMTELIKSGIKMSAEKETAYEPDILVLMETVENIVGAGKKTEIYRKALVLKDRYRMIDGKSFKNPTYKDFSGLIEKMLSGQKRAGDYEENRDDFSELESSNEDWQKRRDVALEQIDAVWTQVGLGTSKEDKKIKLDLCEAAFDTTSKTKIESLSVEKLEAAYEKILDFKRMMLEYQRKCAETSEKFDVLMSYEFIKQIWDKSF